MRVFQQWTISSRRALTTVRFFSSSVEQSKQRHQCAVALSAALELRRQYPAPTIVGFKNGFVECGESIKLQMALERMRTYHSLELLSGVLATELPETGSSCSDVKEVEVLNPKVNIPDEDITGTVFDLPKKLQPECPEGVVVLSFYGSTARDINTFARSRMISSAGKKLDVYKRILAAFSLPDDQLFITESDIRRPRYSLRHVFLESVGCKPGASGTAVTGDSPGTGVGHIALTGVDNGVTGARDPIGQHYALKVQYPDEPVPDAQYPISHFIYISTPDEAESALAFLSDNNIRWDDRSVSQSRDTKTPNSKFCLLKDVHPALSESEFEFTSPPIGSSIGVDVETTGLDPYNSNLRVITLSWPGYPALIFDVKKLWGWGKDSILPPFRVPSFDSYEIVPIYNDPTPAYKVPTPAPTPINDVSSFVSNENVCKTSPQYDQAVIKRPKLDDSEREVLIRLWRKVKSILEDTKVTKCFFNGKFDYKFLRLHFGTTIVNPIKDAMLDSYLLQAGLDANSRTCNLNSVVDRYLNFELSLPKTPPQSCPDLWNFEDISADQLLYAARDAAVLPYLSRRLTRLIAAGGLCHVSRLESQCMRGVAEIELNGMVLNVERHEAIKQMTQERRKTYEDRLRRELGWDNEEGALKNMNSPAQVLRALQEKNILVEIEKNTYNARDEYFVNEMNSAGLPPTGVLLDDPLKPTDGPSLCGNGTPGNRTLYGFAQTTFTKTMEKGATLIQNTGVQTLKMAKGGDSLIEALLMYRKSRKLETAFLNTMDGWVNHKTGRVHPQLNQTGTNSGRFSCSSPNLQQIPRDRNFRACFTASPGYKLVIADMSQIELRIAADLAPDFLMIDAFSRGDDLHRLTASLLKGVSMADVSKSDRQLAKAVNFGLIYGITARGLKEYAMCSYGVTLTLDEAALFRSKYFENYQGIASWHRRVKNRSKSEGHHVYEVGDWMEETRTRSQRRALFSQSQFQKLLNYPIQGTAADIIKESVVMLLDVIPKVNGRLLHCIHDEVIVEVPEDKKDEALSLVVSTMQEAGNKYLKYLKCIVEGAIGTSWSDKP